MDNAFIYIYIYFILNCGLHNFNLFMRVTLFNPLGSGYVIQASTSRW